MPLKRETLNMNKSHPYALWNVIHMHKVRCEARGYKRGRKDPLSTGVALIGQQHGRGLTPLTPATSSDPTSARSDPKMTAEAYIELNVLMEKSNRPGGLKLRANNIFQMFV